MMFLDDVDDPVTASEPMIVDWLKSVVLCAACACSALVVGGFGFVIYKLLF